MTLVHRDSSVARNDMTIARSSSPDFTGGHATYFDQEGMPGACGAIHRDSDLIAAISLTHWGSDPGSSPSCGRSITITNTDNGKTTTVVVADLCPSCGENDLDFSIGAFSLIDESEGLYDGILPIVWQYDD